MVLFGPDVIEDDLLIFPTPIKIVLNLHYLDADMIQALFGFVADFVTFVDTNCPEPNKEPDDGDNRNSRNRQIPDIYPAISSFHSASLLPKFFIIKLSLIMKEIQNGKDQKPVMIALSSFFGKGLV